MPNSFPPLYYDEISSAYSDKKTPDSLTEKIFSYQYEDWRELRFAEVDSEKYRRGIHRLVMRLVEANLKMETKSAESIAPHSTEASGNKGISPAVQVADEEPGDLDRISDFIKALPVIRDTMNNISEEMFIIGEIFTQGTVEIKSADKKENPILSRIEIATVISEKLSSPVDKLMTLRNVFSEKLFDLDQGIRVIISHIAIHESSNPSKISEVCNFFKMVRELSESSRKGLGAAKQMSDFLPELENYSRNLRPILRRLREALITIASGIDVTEGWPTLIDQTGIKCNEAPGKGRKK